MSARVIIESAGDHVFDLNHLRRQGAEELVSRWLGQAHLDDGLWRVRVEKKITCNGETRPVIAVGVKPWCCYIKIKPGDNDTAHFCSLLVPKGLRGEAVFAALKGVENHIDRNWRHDAHKRGAAIMHDPQPERVAEVNGAEADEVEQVEEPTVAEGQAGTAEMHGWTNDPENLQLALLEIHDLSRKETGLARERFVEVLGEKLGWQGLRRRQIGGMFTSLVRKGYIVGVKQGSRSLGYALTDKGRQIIAPMLGKTQEPPPPAPAPALPTDPSSLLETLAGLTHKIADAGTKFRENRARRAQLMAEVEKLDAEARQLEAVVYDPEVQPFLQRLAQLNRQSP